MSDQTDPTVPHVFTYHADRNAAGGYIPGIPCRHLTIADLEQLSAQQLRSVIRVGWWELAELPSAAELGALGEHLVDELEQASAHAPTLAPLDADQAAAAELDALANAPRIDDR